VKKEMSSLLKRKEFLLIILAIVSFFIYIPYFFTVPQIMTDIETILRNAATPVNAVGAAIGVYYMTRRTITKVSQRGKGWYYQLLMGASAWYMIIVGLVLGRDNIAFVAPSEAFIIPGDATIYAIICFYLVSSSARAFKVKDVSSGLLMASAVLVMFRMSPIFQALFPGVSPIGDWVYKNITMAASRVFSISVGLGGIVLAVRLLMGKENSMLGFFTSKEED
jgi:hypothetical protein